MRILLNTFKGYVQAYPEQTAGDGPGEQKLSVSHNTHSNSSSERTLVSDLKKLYLHLHCHKKMWSLGCMRSVKRSRGAADDG
jgi:hypothetical protein